ncbi:signal recognition particle subunit SRP68-like [Scylla paramamosain]|uniref:signal recognition particle subunit SRP68-like n=1 Tax=Scylla paramamosain TaxID=85552 RepID=UPI0030827C7E
MTGVTMAEVTDGDLTTTADPTSAAEPGQEEGKKTLYTLKVCPVVKEAQLAHGLRHSDYQLYRQYCSRRIHRLRKNLDFIQGDRKNFRKKLVTPEVLKDERFLYIPLMTVERYWAYAMQLKEESAKDSRKKFSMRNKLRKAASYVAAFERLVEESDQCDARTQLEVQGYSAWLQGTVLFELAEWTGQWARPVEYFNKALAIYSKVQGAVSEEEQEVYTAKIQEVEVKLRFCRHHLGDRSATDTLLAMRGNEALGDKLDNLLASARERQANTLSEVTWKGRTLAVKHEKVRLFLVNEGLIHEELARTEEANERVRLLDRLLMECKDAIQLVRDDLKADASFKPRQQTTEGPVSPLHFLHTYLSYHRLNLTTLRNLALAHTWRMIINGEVQVEDGKKGPKLQDLVRLHEIIIQNLKELPNLPGLEDDLDLRTSVEGQVIAHRAHRCYFVAESFLKVEKWAEALVLYQQALNYVEEAKSGGNLQPSVLVELEHLTALIDSKKFTAHAQAILAAQAAPGAASSTTKSTGTKEGKLLIERLDEYIEDPSLTSSSPQVAQVPPPMTSVPCKPLFFDLALNHIEFPSLDDKIENKKTNAPAGVTSGLTGLVKGLWGGWGAKK